MSTPLHLAVEKGHKDAIILLLSKGAKIELQDYEFNTPLSCAMYEGNLSIMQQLIDGGANVDGQCVEGTTPLALAVRTEKLDAVELLLRNKANPNWTCKYTGMSILHYAISCCDGTDIIQLLLDYGADKMVKDKAGNTPLAWSRKCNNTDAFDVIIDH